MSNCEGFIFVIYFPLRDCKNNARYFNKCIQRDRKFRKKNIRSNSIKELQYLNNVPKLQHVAMVTIYAFIKSLQCGGCVFQLANAFSQ